MVSLYYLKIPPPRAFNRGILPLDITRIHPSRTWKALKEDADTPLTTAIQTVRHGQTCISLLLAE